jgi:hypothetical protein
MVRLMSESSERRLLLRESITLRLHLLVCAWCTRYLKQIAFLQSLLRHRNAIAKNLAPTLTSEARNRIAEALKNPLPKR